VNYIAISVILPIIGKTKSSVESYKTLAVKSSPAANLC